MGVRGVSRTINYTATTEIYTLSLHDAFRSRWSPYHFKKNLEPVAKPGRGAARTRRRTFTGVRAHQGAEQRAAVRDRAERQPRCPFPARRGAHRGPPRPALLRHA